MDSRNLLFLAGTAALCASALLPGAAAAAESLETCTGFIDSVPAVISAQGVWCMRADLSTAIDTGSAIRVDVNNVTIDCNDFKLGGLAAGPATAAQGISSSTARANVTVRRCNIRGFFNGVSFSSPDSSGVVIEDNRFDGNLVRGVLANGDGHVIRRNRIVDTGGTTSGLATYGVQVGGDNMLIEDNQVTGVFTAAANGNGTGIYVTGAGNLVRFNRISNLIPSGSGVARGITLSSDGANLAEGNVMINSPARTGHAIYATGSEQMCIGNRSIGFASGVLVNCTNGGDNIGD